jgi:hypothetical protein
MALTFKIVGAHSPIFTVSQVQGSLRLVVLSLHTYVLVSDGYLSLYMHYIIQHLHMPGVYESYPLTNYIAID